MTAYPEWLRVLAWFYIALSIASSLIIAFDVTRHRQKMWIMEPVWVISALYFSLVAVYWYLRTRPALEKGSIHPRPDGDSDQREEPKPIQVAVATLHCGAGCALGDIIAENLVPAFGWQFAGEFGTRLVVDFTLAYLFGIVFQYLTIAPMRNLLFVDGLKAAIKADTISITMFQVGMFGWMALVHFVLFPTPRLTTNDAVFWFMMQIAMMIGWGTSYPANIWLIKKGWKEKMPEYVPERTEVSFLRVA